MSDVSAVVLSVGEPFVQRALDSLARQTIPIAKVVMVEHVTPFTRALNQGAHQVESPFFLQVDADMVLDPACAEELFAAVEADVGIVVGELRDELEGHVVGVKLFRAQCFRRNAFPDTVSPDTDFVRRLTSDGWRIKYLSEKSPEAHRTIGEHRPDYSPNYVLRKFLLEGARIRHRAARHGLYSRLETLERHKHPLGVLAQLALGHGFFLPITKDELKPYDHDPRSEWLTSLLRSSRAADDCAAELFPLTRHARLRDVFRRFLDGGRRLAASEAGATVNLIFDRLASPKRSSRALVAKVALSHGLLLEPEQMRRLGRDESALRRLMIYSLGRHSTLVDHVAARVKHAIGRDCHARSYVPW